MTGIELPNSKYAERADTINAVELLALDDVSLKWRHALAITAEQVYRATLGNSNPRMEAFKERIANPQIGDVVYENSTLFMDEPERHMKGFGILKNIAEEPYWSDEEWAEEVRYYQEAGKQVPERPTQTVYYIQYGPEDDDVTKWSNASFQVVPMSPNFPE